MLLLQRIFPSRGTVRSSCLMIHRYYSSNQNNMNSKMEQEQLIATQTKRAVDYWNNSNKNDPLKISVHDEVLEKLQQGLVPPIFHSLCQTPEKRLFDPITKLSNEMDVSLYIHLSSEPVTAGTEIPTDNKRGKIELDDETSYMDSFFTLNGVPRQTVVDREFRNPWEFNAKYTSYVAALVNEPAKMVGEDIEVTNLESTFCIDQQHGRNLITRRLSRGVVGDCFHRSEADSNYAIVGSEGIGKSWTLIYAMQQALLYANVCVLFYFSKYREAIACIRKGNEVFVWVAGDIEVCYSTLFHNSNVLVLLDPVDGARGGANFVYGARRLIIAASNNDQHLGGIGKHTGGFKRILSTYSAKELKVALCYVTDKEDIYQEQHVLQNALQRANIVGRVPRYLVNVPKYDDRKETTEYALLKLKHIHFQDLLHWNGIVNDRNNEKYYESLFLINAKREYDNDKDNLVDGEVENCFIGYDGECGINYGKSNISIISNHVFNTLVGDDRARILSYWCHVGINEPSILKTAVMDLFWQDLQNERIQRRTFEMHQDSHEGECMNLKFPSPKNGWVDVDITDLATTCFSSEHALCRMKTGTTLIDVTGPGKNIFHVAVGKTYPHLNSVVKELLLASGHIKAIESIPSHDGISCYTPEYIKVATEVDPINLYWVIPYGLEKKWYRRPARTMSIMNDDDPTTRLVKECFNSCVKQFVLVMDEVPLQVMEDWDTIQKRKRHQ